MAVASQWPDWLETRPMAPGEWPGELTPHGARRVSPFRAPFASTVALLWDELRFLQSTNDTLLVAVPHEMWRRDGKGPKAGAKAYHPGVVLAYNLPRISPDFPSQAQAKAFLDRYGGSFKEAAKRLHPDMAGGNEALFKLAQEADRVLEPESYRIAVDKFTSWEDNLRAIALALKDLRRLRRYGVAQSNELHAGFRQITAGGAS